MILSILYLGTLITCDYVPMDEGTASLLSALGLLSSFITTVTSTSLIALKIILITRQNHMRYSYGKIIEILIQSAALVSIVLLPSSILELVDYVRPYRLDTTTGRVLYQMWMYLGYIQGPVTVCTSRSLSVVNSFNTTLTGNWTYAHCIPRSGGTDPS